MARKPLRELFFEHYPEPFLFLNNGIIIDFNTEASLFFGLSRSSELMGSSFLELIKIEDQDRVTRFLNHFHSCPCTEKNVCVRVSEGCEKIVNLTSAALNVEEPSLRWVRLKVSSTNDEVWDVSLKEQGPRRTNNKRQNILFLKNSERSIRFPSGTALELKEVNGTQPTSTRAFANLSDCPDFSFACFFKSSPAVMLLINYETGIITDANPAAVKFYGYEYDELIGKSIIEISTLSESQARREMEAAFRKQRQHFRFKHKLSCGEVRNVEVYSGPVEIKDAHFLLSIVFDGTERYRTEEALRESETLFRKLFLNSGIGNAIVTPDRHFVDANPAYLRMIGYTYDELRGLVIDQITHPDDHESDIRLFTLLVYGEIDSYSIEKRFLTKKGQIVFVDLTVSAVRDENGIAKLIIGQAQDITARKKSEKDLQESEERFRLLAQNARDLIYRYRLKPDPGFEYISPSSSWLIGYSPEEFYSDPLIGKKIIHPDDQPEFDRIISRPGSEKDELRLIHKEGHIVWMEHQIVKICDDRGETIAYEGISRDITARKEAEDLLIRAKEKAEEMSRLKDSFLANMSHEIRTPLTSIIGFADVLYNDVDGSAKEFANQIRLGGYRLLDTLNALLDFAQLRSGTYQLNPQRFNPADEARNALQAFERRTKSKGLRMEFLVQSGCPKEICIDRTAFEKIVNHLVSNAVKYTNQGSVSVSLSGQNDAVILKVEDTGIGMSRGYQNRIFEEFRQESSGLARRYEGNGLGLAIIKHLVDMLGGQIEVKSTVGTGTIFTVTLPTCTPCDCQQFG